jgi:ATP-dependent exoDNAse (exonuclease V) beta subunit
VSPAGAKGAVSVVQPHHLVRASAGSGKTHRLALRFLELLFAGGRPDTIVAATFTREAAGEILARVLVRLAQAVDDRGAARRLCDELGGVALREVHFRRALDLLCDALDRLSVSTLDSLYYRMTGAVRFELGLPAKLVVTSFDDPLAARLREEAAEEALAALAEDGWQELLDLFEDLNRAEARRSVWWSLDAMLVELYEVFREAPERALWQRLVVPAGLEETELAAACARLQEVVVSMAPGALREALRGNLDAAERGDWPALAARGPAAKVLLDGKSASYRRRRLSPQLLAALVPLVEHARHCLLAAARDRTEATYRLLEVFDRNFEELRRRQGLLLFSDLARGLLDWFDRGEGDRIAELYYRLDGRIAHLLLDEFQDTSLEQWRVLLPIAAEIRAHGDGSRSFFCVGDPKQAIYGWRGGCADLFDQIEADLALDPQASEHLDVSYRSSQVVLDAVNRLFGALPQLPCLADRAEVAALWASSFKAHRAARQEAGGYVEVVSGPSEAEDHREWVAGRLAELVSRSPAASLAVLVQTNREVAEMLDALRLAGVEASAVGGSRVADDAAVSVVISCLRLADHPGDTAAALHIEGSPLAGDLGLEQSGAAGRRAASRRLRQRWWREGAGGLVSALVAALHAHVDPRGAQRLDQVLDLTGRFEASGVARPIELARYLEAATVTTPQSAGVRVMTIHRSKGLEFDFVVLPALERALLGRVSPVYLQRHSPLAEVEAVHRSVSRSLRQISPQLFEAHAAESARRLRDDLSALYVAMTRARYALWLWPRGGQDDRGTGLSFARIVREGLRSARGDAVGAVDAAVGEVQFVSGTLSAALAAVNDRVEASRAPKQAEMLLPGGAAAVARRDRGEGDACLPVADFDELRSGGARTGLELLRGPTPEDQATLEGRRQLGVALKSAEPAKVRALADAVVWMGERADEAEAVDRPFAVEHAGRVVTGRLRGYRVPAGAARRLIVVEPPRRGGAIEGPNEKTELTAAALRRAARLSFDLQAAEVALLRSSDRGWVFEAPASGLSG